MYVQVWKSRTLTIILDFSGESSQAAKELKRLNTITPTMSTMSPKMLKDIAKKFAKATDTRAEIQWNELISYLILVISLI